MNTYTKVCNTCKVEKSLDDYSVYRANKVDGKQHVCKGCVSKYNKANRAMRTLRQNARDERMTHCRGWADIEAIKAVYIESRRLTELTGVKHVVDHIVPLMGDRNGICGLHVANNLQVISEKENAQKSAKFEG